MPMTKAPGWSDTCKVGGGGGRERKRERNIYVNKSLQVVELFSKLGDNNKENCLTDVTVCVVQKLS